MERWDVYDRDGNRTGDVVDKGGLSEGQYHLSVHLCVFNSRGEVLLRRQKKTGVWDLSASGDARSGETARDAAERVAREQLGLTITLDRPSFVLSVPDGFDAYFVVVKDLKRSDVMVDETAVSGLRGANEKVIRDLSKANLFVPIHTCVIKMAFGMRHGIGGAEEA
ncbi:MAG: NUDIX domain-containing protein [Sphaerochaeta sp.]|jgi:ADP-ribose pyrophosphatase YjhB (NUDIX family)|nr:NUDIX domain-containing protein [Sphaerochaeta sp.]